MEWFVYITITLVALVQIPIAIDLLRFVFPKWKLARLASRAVYFILFTAMGSIFCIGLSYHLFVYLPLLAGEHPLQSVKGFLHVLFAVWVWVNVVGNYYFSVFLHPGQDRDYKAPSRGPKLCFMSEDGVITEVKEEQSAVIQHGSESTSATDGKRFYCDPSIVGTRGPPASGSEWKPSRTHYCKICECAVPYMDHHCPFTGNCAGLRNYFNFFLSLCYGVLGLFYAVVITLPYFFDCNLKNVMWYFGVVSDRVSSPLCAELGTHTRIFLPVFAGFCMAGNVLLLQVLFLAADLSTYNILSNWSKFPMLLFVLQRLRARKFLERDSRFNVLLRNRRKSVLSYFIPTKN